MSLARVQFFSISLDGFGTGEGQSHDAPFGHAGERLHEWMAGMARGPRVEGLVGANPPFHTPTFVLTHHPRPSIEMEGGTTYHFIDASPAETLETAREGAGGQDVLGGGCHRGVRLWDGLEGLEQDYAIEATSSPAGVTHVTFTRVGI